jgi:hypothetical protein
MGDWGWFPCDPPVEFEVKPEREYCISADLDGYCGVRLLNAASGHVLLELRAPEHRKYLSEVLQGFDGAVVVQVGAAPVLSGFARRLLVTEIASGVSHDIIAQTDLKAADILPWEIEH